MEFLYRPADSTLAFLEVNTRLQVPHAVTELTAGLDLVKLQLRMAHGRAPRGPTPPPSFGYAIEARLECRGPRQRVFAPAPGKIELLSLASGPGVRIDTGVAAGDVVPHRVEPGDAQDHHLGQRPQRGSGSSATGGGRKQCVPRAAANHTFLLSLLSHPDYQAGTITTSWLDRLGDSWRSGSAGAPIGVLLAVVEVMRDSMEAEHARFLATAARGRPHVSHDSTTVMNLRHDGNRYRIAASEIGPDQFRATIDDISVVFEVHRLSQFTRRVVVGTTTVRAQVATHGSDYLVEVEGFKPSDLEGRRRTRRRSLSGAGGRRHGEAGRFGRDRCAGDRAGEHEDRELGFESVSGRVREVFVSANVQVDAGASLLRIDAHSEDEEPTGGGARLRFDGFPTGYDGLSLLHWSFLGYDSEPVRDSSTRPRLTERAGGARRSTGLCRREQALSRNRRLDGDGEGDEITPPRSTSTPSSVPCRPRRRVCRRVSRQAAAPAGPLRGYEPRSHRGT